MSRPYAVVELSKQAASCELVGAGGDLNEVSKTLWTPLILCGRRGTRSRPVVDERRLDMLRDWNHSVVEQALLTLHADLTAAHGHS